MNLILMLITLAFSMTALAEWQLNKNTFKAEISKIYDEHAEDFVRRSMHWMKIYQNEVPPGEPNMNRHWQTDLVGGDNRICKTTKNHFGKRLARSVKDCFYYNPIFCGEDENGDHKNCPEKDFDAECVDFGVNYDELQLCCENSTYGMRANPRYDVYYQSVHEMFRVFYTHKNCCRYPGSYCVVDGLAAAGVDWHKTLHCCGKAQGLAHDFECLMDKNGGNEDYEGARVKTGHCWRRSFAGLYTNNTESDRSHRITQHRRVEKPYNYRRRR
jgi:hypothetical protein